MFDSGPPGQELPLPVAPMFEEAFGYSSRHPYLALWKKRGGFGMVDAHNNYASSSPTWQIFLNHPLVRPHLNSFLAETHNLLLDRTARTFSRPSGRHRILHYPGVARRT